MIYTCTQQRSLIAAESYSRPVSPHRILALRLSCVFSELSGTGIIRFRLHVPLPDAG